MYRKDYDYYAIDLMQSAMISVGKMSTECFTFCRGM